MSKHKLINTESLARAAGRRAKQWRLARVGIVFSAIAIATYGGWTALSATKSASADSLASGKSDNFVNVDRRNRDDSNNRNDKRNQNNKRNSARNSKDSKKNDSKNAVDKVTDTAKGAVSGATGAAAGAVAAVTSPSSVAANVHKNITTTIFWAGEAADASNANISNTPSAWDEIWSTHYGGYDDPNNRNGFLPKLFTPKENPFYFALPYNDYDANGNRRPDAKNCSAITGVTASNTSWCKNAWIKVTKGTKTVYGQWQDVGPMLEDDSAYVFGTAQPRNTELSKAGLDLSPAMADYLGSQDVDKADWTFVSAASVPAGPWKNIVTVSGVFWQ